MSHDFTGVLSIAFAQKIDKNLCAVPPASTKDTKMRYNVHLQPILHSSNEPNMYVFKTKSAEQELIRYRYAHQTIVNSKSSLLILHNFIISRALLDTTANESFVHSIQPRNKFWFCN